MENQKNNNTYELRVAVETISGVREDGTKYNFKVFKGVTKNGKKCRFKLTKDCENVPKEDGVYIFKVLKSNMNESKQDYYLTYWIKNIESYTRYDEYVNNGEEKNDLPF